MSACTSPETRRRGTTTSLLALVLVVIVSLVGCGDEDDDGPAGGLASTTTPPDPTVASDGSTSTSATAAPAAATEVDPAPFREHDTLFFETPSHNIACAITTGDGEGAVRCDIAEKTWEAPHRAEPCEAGDYGHSVTTDATGTSFECASDAVGGGRVLPYGSSLRGGQFTCTSARTGVTCRHANGRGFTLSRASYVIHGAV